MSGAEAIQLCHKQPFDAVLLDLKLGSASGLDVLRDLRSQWPDLPVIVVTAHGSLESAAAAERRGRDHTRLAGKAPTVGLTGSDC